MRVGLTPVQSFRRIALARACCTCGQGERPYQGAVSLRQRAARPRRLAFANTERMLSQRISIFLALPFKSLDRLALENRLAAIGRGNTD